MKTKFNKEIKSKIVNLIKIFKEDLKINESKMKD